MMVNIATNDNIGIIITMIIMMTMIMIIMDDQVEFKWIRLGLAAKWEKAVEPALRLATVQVSFTIMYWHVAGCLHTHHYQND